jgi:glutamate racemase
VTMADGVIGVFDSGVGGLTVLQRIAERLPDESIVYLGDTARVPYGTKSPETVIRYARSCAAVLMDQHAKLLVIACNTSSAFALDILEEELAVPVLGVIKPGAEHAVRSTKSGRIGVIGTRGTINSGQYQKHIHAIAPAAEVFVQPCPLFVPLAEEGWVEGPVPRQIASHYLEPLLDHDIDTLVLGCTHYPLLKSVIAQVAGEHVRLVDSAEATSETVANTIEELGIHSQGGEPVYRYLVTDSPASFSQAGEAFLGRVIERVAWVDI